MGSSSLATNSRGTGPVSPVAFPPGRARLLTSPIPTGSLTPAKTTGIAEVALLTARAGSGLEAVAMTSGFN